MSQGQQEMIFESEAELFESAYQKFAVYRQLLQGILTKTIRHLIVKGAPGIGKSHIADEILGKSNEIKYNRVSGHTTPLSLYNDLYGFRDRNCVSVFDDCDAVFHNGEALNILKALTDTYEVRTVTWSSTARAIVPQYDFEGSIVILTNVDLRDSVHYKAILDRVFYYELDLTEAEKVAWISHIASRITGIDAETAKELSRFIRQNISRLNSDLSVRTFIKLMELYKFNPHGWQDLAKMLMFNNPPKD